MLAFIIANEEELKTHNAIRICTLGRCSYTPVVIGICSRALAAGGSDTRPTLIIETTDTPLKKADLQFLVNDLAPREGVTEVVVSPDNHAFLGEEKIAISVDSVADGILRGILPNEAVFTAPLSLMCDCKAGDKLTFNNGCWTVDEEETQAQEERINDLWSQLTLAQN